MLVPYVGTLYDHCHWLPLGNISDKGVKMSASKCKLVAEMSVIFYKQEQLSSRRLRLQLVYSVKTFDD